MNEVKIILPQRDSDFLSDSLRLLTKRICEAHPELEGGYGLGGPHGYGEDFENDVFVMRRFYWGDCDCGYDKREEDWCSSHKHSPDCYQTELRNRKIATGHWKMREHDWLEWWNDAVSYETRQAIEEGLFAELCLKHGLNSKFGAAVHCTCNHEPEWLAFCATPEGRCADTCSTALPNFRHKATGFEVRWYKYIGRSTELTNEPADVAAVLSECLRSVTSTDSKSIENIEGSQS